jgi:hypothetical protein
LRIQTFLRSERVGRRHGFLALPAPGEVVSQEAVDYLVTGVAAGMLIPDAADSSMKSLRVVAE